MKLKLGDFFSKITHLGNRNLGFRSDKSEQNKALASAFKGSAPTSRVLTGQPMPSIVRAQAAGRFELQSFQRVRTAANAPAGSGVGGLAPAVAAAAPNAAVAAAAAAAAAAPAALNLQSARETGAHAMTAARQAMSHWSDQTVQARHPRDQVLARQPAEAAIRQASEAIEALQRAGGSATEVAHGRQWVSEMAIQLALGVPHSRLQGGQGLARAELTSFVQGAAQALMELGDRLRPYQTDSAGAGALLPDLARRLTAGQAAQDAASADPLRLRDALVRVEHNAKSIVQACTPPADGSGLLVLARSDAELQPVVAMARRAGLERLLHKAYNAKAGARGLSAADRQELSAVAGRIVDRELEGVMARQRLMNALRLNQKSLGWDLHDKRIDASLIDGLRRQFGSDAEKIGLVLAACFSLGAAADADPDMQRYRDAVKMQLESAHQRRQALHFTHDSGHPELRKATAEVLTLDRLAGALQTTQDRLEKLSQWAKPLIEEEKAIKTRLAQPGAASPEDRARLARVKDMLQDIDRQSAFITGAGRSGGLSAQELQQMGLSRAETDAVLARAARLSEMGLWGARQLGDAVKTANHVVQVLQDGLHQAPKAGRSNEQLAVNLGAALLGQATGLPTLQGVPSGEAVAAVVQQQWPDLATVEDPLHPLLAQHDAQMDAHLSLAAQHSSAATVQSRASGAAASAAASAAAPNLASALESTAQSYEEFSLALQRETQRLENLPRATDEARSTLESFNAALPRGAKPLSTRRPEGLALSLNLRAAARLLDDFDSISTRLATDRNFAQSPQRQQRLREITRDLGTLVDRLKGFKPESMSMAGTFSRSGVRTLDDLRRALGSANSPERQRLMKVADAIVLLRRDQAQTQVQLHEKSRQLVQSLDAVMARRVQVMDQALGAGAHAKVRDLVRAAILQQREASGQSIEQFRPAEHAGAIQARLQAWGLDTARLRPEINQQLAESFGALELSLWAKQAAVGEDALLAQAPPPRQGPDPEAAQRMVDGLKPGSVMKFFGGSRWEVEASVPLSLDGALAAGGKYENSKVSNLELECGRREYVLTVRSGREHVAGVEASYTLGKLFGGSLKAKAGLEGTYGRVDGVRLVFDTGKPESVTKLKALMQRIVQGEVLDHDDLLAADDIAPSFEAKGLGKGTVGISNKPKATAANLGELGGEEGPALDFSSGLQVRAAASLEAGKEWGSENNTNTESYADAFETTVQAHAGVAFKIGAELETGGPGSLVGDGGIGQSVDLAMGTKLKIKRTGTFDAQGTLESGGLSRELRAGQGGARRLGLTVGGASVRAFLERPENAARKVDYERALGLIQGNDILRFKFAMKPEIRAAVSELSRQARDLEERMLQGDPQRREGSGLMKQAAALRREMDILIKNDDHYEPEKIQIVPMQQNVQAMAKALAVLPFFHSSSFREEQTFYTAFELSLR